uniref:Cytochrome c oxidase subunit 3 n=1 Tax=Dorypteryx domestica TaxID=209979 RepID=A0A343QCA0_9NEOP|nr:cytochrome c oxidase subunit III [Dorypteryx domestica]ATU07047.1 cytochrome c oxidase subunit III [Dorypteryx domestica]
MSMYNHPYHLVTLSPWPLTGALGSMIFMTGLVKWFFFFNNQLMFLGSLINVLTMYQWWRDITRESTFQGFHSLKVYSGMRWGMILFITSEVLFFVSFFWGFFHSSLSPSQDIGLLWPPKGIIPFNPIQIPLLNTIILISSGISVTWSHHALMKKNLTQALISLYITVILGVYFTFLQALEYNESPFTIADSIYGSCFFMATGFHGIHVLIGTTFLLMMIIRMSKNHFSNDHHFGFEAAAWYWHFVDVVWLFLYVSIYWWGF